MWECLLSIPGTVITEWKDGTDLCKKFLKNDDSVTKTVQQLVNIAVRYNFEGWLINIENRLEVCSNSFIWKQKDSNEIRGFVWRFR